MASQFNNNSKMMNMRKRFKHPTEERYMVALSQAQANAFKQEKWIEVRDDDDYDEKKKMT